MGWQVGFDSRWHRDIGYGVPATCDHPGCGAAIDRGLAYVCGGEPYGGEDGCGLFFCGEHLFVGNHRQMCERCLGFGPPFDPTPDTAEWTEWKLTDESWAAWRDENPETVKAMQASLVTAKEGG
jgi:hypothetical protein